ncbi:MAG: 4Fe-4S dicluster domain-containing protein [Tissierellia bacterium]|nr:4Fe-4S dicluster domain-containing protein [Tissierellia bacterium]
MDLVQKIYQGGVVGAGGAGFPTHVKYKTKANSLLINAAECEPLLYTDQYEMEYFPEEIIRGIELGRSALEASNVKIAIKEKHERSIKALEKAIESLQVDMDIVKMESYYPAGDEHSVIYECLKTPLAPAALPLTLDAVVSNVTTMRNIYLASQDIPVTDKKITVTGEVEKPIVIDVPIGTTIEECLSLAGKTTVNPFAILIGGPMMGKMIFDKDISTTYVTKTTGGLIVLPMDHPLIARRRQTLKQIQNQTASACIQCDFCTELCPRYLKGHPLHPHEVMKAFGFGDMTHPKLPQASLCCECGICELYSCPMGLSPRIVNAEVKKIMRKEGITKNFTPLPVHPMEEVRKLPTDVLMKKIQIEQYDQHEPLPLKEYTSNKVRLLLSQHIGKPASPIVKIGDRVKRGQEIGHVEETDMGALIHASIDGTVTKITNEFIEITGEGETQ